MTINRDDPLLARDWSRVAEAKTERWRARKHAGGASEGIRLGCVLREYVRAVRPDWPSTDERAADLAHHERLSMLLQVDVGGR